MTKKILAAIMGAAMVINVSPVITLAEPAADNETATAAETVTDAGVTGAVSAAGVEITEAELTGAELTGAEAAESAALEVSAQEANSGQERDVRAEITDQTTLEAAIAQGGVVDLTGKTITLERALTVNNSVTITGGTLIGSSGVTGNLVTLTGDTAALDGVTIITAAENKTALHAYRTALTANNLTIDHTNAAGGAPVIVNGGSAVFTGNLDLTLGANSWYGVNVDNATADFSGASIAKIDTLSATQSVVCVENGGTVPGKAANTTEVVTADGQTAYVQDEDLPAFLKAKKEKDVISVTLLHDVNLSEPLYLEESMTVNGQGFYFNGTSALGKDNVVTVMAGEADIVSLNDLGIRTDAANKSALHIYRSRVALQDVTLDNTDTAGGAGMIVNGGTADVSGGLEIILGENSWGGINVDGVNGESSVNFAEGSKVTVQDTAGKDLDAIYIENGDANQVEINGAENAGLVQDENGNYVTDDTPEEPGETPEDPGDQNGSGDTDEGQKDPEQKPSGNDGDQNPSDNNAQADAEKEGVKSPKTGDSSALLLALSALAASGTAATVVLRKKKDLGD
ncbi:MAG: LPXTG cell wall anchor domain-containing protein [Lachnospiraceae bacterium]|nr:LPXTG cell wall anchor domain-containing protein [Lachnospiraceae bacterium]